MDINQHRLVPKHSKLSDAERKALLEQYHVAVRSLPRILASEPALQKLSVKPGDVIKAERQSKTAGVSNYYRVVVDG